MRKKLLYLFLLLIVASNIILLTIVFNKGPKKGNGPKHNFISTELNFTEDQEERFLFLDQMHRREMIEFDQEINQLRKQLFNSFEDSNFSSDSITNKIGELESLRLKELIAFFKEVRKLCSQEQASKFDKIIQRALQKRGPKPPGRDGRRKGPPPHRQDF